MAELLVKDSTGKIWKDQNSGKIILGKKFSEEPIQDGLVFWGRSDPKWLTLVDGLVSEAYDIRGTGQKMVQNTVVNRPTYLNGEIIFNGVKLLTANFTNNAKSLFFVARGVGGNRGTLGSNSSNYFGGYPTPSDVCHVIKGNVLQSNAFYANKTIVATTYAYNPNYVIFHTRLDMGISNAAMILGTVFASTYFIVKEWGWYNRVLNELEVIYNIRALNERNKVFTW